MLARAIRQQHAVTLRRTLITPTAVRQGMPHIKITLMLYNGV